MGSLRVEGPRPGTDFASPEKGPVNLGQEGAYPNPWRNRAARLDGEGRGPGLAEVKINLRGAPETVNPDAGLPPVA